MALHNKLNTTSFITRSRAVHGTKFSYDKSICAGARSIVIIGCSHHGDFKIEARLHIRGTGCHQCLIDKKTKHFIDRSREIHTDKYSYLKTRFLSANRKVIIECPVHGDFSQRADGHLDGYGCRKCARIVINNKHKLDQELFIQMANKVHNYRYDYSKVQYVHGKKDIVIVCKIHGDFHQTPDHHIHSKSGCQKCGIMRQVKAIKVSLDEFVLRSNKIHDYKYDYSKVIFINCRIPVVITCNLHDDFEQVPTEHMRGYGCPKCNISVSKMETKWLDSLHIPLECRQVSIQINGRIIKADAYDPVTNTVYEFYGDFWHGNPTVFDPNKTNNVKNMTFLECYNRTLDREDLIKSNGYNMITMWENEFKTLNDKS
jgi:hypothetical protein